MTTFGLVAVRVNPENLDSLELPPATGGACWNLIPSYKKHIFSRTSGLVQQFTKYIPWGICFYRFKYISKVYLHLFHHVILVLLCTRK